MKERIRSIMELKGMTQQEFSQFIEMSPASLSSIFTGRTNPTLNVVESIKKKFANVSVEWLMFGKGPMFLSDENDSENQNETPSDVSEMETSDIQNENSPTPNFQYRNNNIQGGNKISSAREPNNKESYCSNAPTFSDMKIINNNIRKIKEIRVFYDDQTYESFVPKE